MNATPVASAATVAVSLLATSLSKVVALAERRRFSVNGTGVPMLGTGEVSSVGTAFSKVVPITTQAS